MSEKIEVILVDIGTTVIKSAEVINEKIGALRNWDQITDLIMNYSDIPMVLSSVGIPPSKLAPQLNPDKDLLINHQTKIPVWLRYKTPETLGVDRMVAAVGVNHLFPDEDNLIIDLGTCATIDFIDKKGIFHGGTITPGLTLRMRAMSHFTESLPDISGEWQKIAENRSGRSTKESLLNGSLTGLTYELNAIIETYSKNFASLNIILTGGDAQFFESRIKAHTFAGSKIVEIGLYRIWKYQ